MLKSLCVKQQFLSGRSQTHEICSLFDHLTASHSTVRLNVCTNIRFCGDYLPQLMSVFAIPLGNRLHIPRTGENKKLRRMYLLHTHMNKSNICTSLFILHIFFCQLHLVHKSWLRKLSGNKILFYGGGSASKLVIHCRKKAPQFSQFSTGMHGRVF